MEILSYKKGSGNYTDYSLKIFAGGVPLINPLANGRYYTNDEYRSSNIANEDILSTFFFRLIAEKKDAEINLGTVSNIQIKA